VTASRTCPVCGADLHGDVRWCLRCYEPVRELTPREPVWAPGEFVDAPIGHKGAVPHWSRWEKSATTFGPAGRVAITVVAVLWLLTAAVQSPITTIFVLPLVSVVIRNVWRPGWVVPPDPAASIPDPTPTPMSTWIWDRSEFLGGVTALVVCIAGLGVLLYASSPIPRFIVIVTAVATCAKWAWRKVGDGR